MCIATDMNITINPFQQLYFSDDIQTENNFVELFSDEVLQTAIHPIFQGGNVVLSGTQGCGKTMILSLLRPEIRIAYANAHKEFPVNEQMRNFVSAGINLTKSRISDLAQVTLHRGDEVDVRELPFYFADFFNYWIVLDLIASVERIAENPEVFDGIVDGSRIDKSVKELANEDCWFGALEGTKTLKELKNRLNSRVSFYRRWMNGNLNLVEPPDEILLSKTNIGEPIARTAEFLRHSGSITADVPVLIRVDQIEELHRAFPERQKRLLLSFRKMLNRAFASRDARIHYRAGTRRYGWANPEYLGIWGSEARLEHRRDYNLIDMDKELFALGETRNSIFERFALDAFQKRVIYYFRNEIDVSELKPNLAKTVFGKSPVAEQRLGRLSTKQDPEQIDRILGLDADANEGWSTEWRLFLRELFRGGTAGMLDAVLAAAWGRQTGGAKFNRAHRESSPPTDSPWKERRWWRKERLDQAVLQLMTKYQQRFVWWGFQDIRSLSGGNIAVFLHICHRVWDGFLKNESSIESERRTDLLKVGTIAPHIQATGILVASNEWFMKLPEEPGGNARQSFVEELGTRLNVDMVNDLSMSYPGGNGISLSLSKFNETDELISALRYWMFEAVGYGVLFGSEHSSKSKRAGKRIKFYLNPILCPRFQLPEARTKEPYYWNIEDLIQLIRKAQVTLPRTKRSAPASHPDHPTLPGFENTEQ